MLREKRYEEVKNIFEEKGVDLTENDIKLYANAFEIIAHYVNHKLTTREIMEVYDFLSDVILNRRPDIKIHVEKKDRIKVQVALMNKIPFIGNKLDLEEKIMLAFCIYLGECIRVYDEETNEEKNGVVLFKSVESIGLEFEQCKSINPSLFEIVTDNALNENREDFGCVYDNFVDRGDITPNYNNGKNAMLTEDDYFIIDVLRYLGAKGDDVLAPMLLLHQDKERKIENTRKLRKYIEFKGKYVTQQDILAKCLQITTPREQYYPCEMYVKYIADTTEKLSNNKIYRVEKVFGDDEEYLIQCDDNNFRELNSGLFETQKVIEVIYTGSENEDGTKKTSKGFEVGRTYKVLSFKMGAYFCDNGYKCMLDEVEPTDFEKEEPKQLVPFEDIDDALRMVIRTLEFGRVHDLATHLHHNCKYISQASEKEFNTKTEIVKHLQRISNTQLEKDVFIDCALATVTECEKTNKFSVDDRCIAIYDENGCESVVFLTLSDDSRLITGIYILNELYKFKLDE